MAQRIDTRPNQTLSRVFGTTTRATVDRIVSTYGRATAADREAGAAWYGRGADIITHLSQRTGHSPEHVAAVISHLSPRTPWGRNIYGATMLVTTGEAPTCLSANIARARRALASPDPLATFSAQAPKTARFARNLLGDRSVVTVDVWALRVAIGRDAEDKHLKRAGVYDAVEHAYRLAAARLGVDPVTVQATTWIVARNGRAH